MEERIKGRVIERNSNLTAALKQMDARDCKLLLVFNNNKYNSILSIGDIQRAIIKGVSLDASIDKILRSNIRVGRITDSDEFIEQEMKKFRMEFMPVVDDDNNLIRVLFWEDIFKGVSIQNHGIAGIPVIIMAGGRGTRLKPITNIIPKPLIPIGDKPIIEWIVDEFHEQGAKDFYFSVNYKKEMIQNYFEEKKDLAYRISYFEETTPQGTAGSLNLLKGKLPGTFVVTNCDILIKEDYSAILDYHRTNKNKLTAVAAIKYYNIPYGILETGEEGLLKDIKEKPELNYLVNAGMYVLEAELLDKIPSDRVYHITDLMHDLISQRQRVGVFPVREGSWMDTGEWNEYMKTSRKMGFDEMNSL